MLAFGAALVGCQSDGAAPSVRSSLFGVLSDGRTVQEVLLENANGMSVKTLNYGALIRVIETRDQFGEPGDVVLGFDNLQSYEARHPYMGVVLGRYAGRIANGRFSLDGVEYELATNNGPNHLHGGTRGFDKALWDFEIWSNASSAGVVYRYLSPDGEEGYPGALKAEVSYTLYNDNRLEVAYRATSDTPTIVNLSQHSYFNLSANPARDILDHRLEVYGDEILELDQTSVPTGRRIGVGGTPFDFKEAKAVGRDIAVEDRQLAIGKGYDHLWILNRAKSEAKLTHAARLTHAGSGRRLDVYTTEPGVQVYTANYLKSSVIGKGDIAYGPRRGICLETQKFPNSPNEPSFPSARLDPGKIYQSTTVFQFSTVSRK